MSISKYNLLIRAAITILGICLISFGIAWMRFSQFGTDPFVTMNIGISQFFRVDFGFIQMLSNLVLLAVMAKVTPKLIHLGTVLGIVVVGYLSDFFLDFLSFLPENFGWRLFAMGIGLLLCCFGVGVYMSADLGISPYDALGMVLERKTIRSLGYKEIRMITDICCVAIGVALGAPIGIGTILTAFCTGPLIDSFKKSVDTFLNTKILQKTI
ncbi:YczE/YyaS/YitT family protein [Enterococcus sp.]|uniref:YczE/YyaS/YitT family protein n=1 Tax=Enterococcus sp. TaxID=35783 RepID=UPI002914E130|nr:YitT family protein [Enterococcus sp.]MDU5336575.1 YitT family protein [Enterococcus sp.]